MTHKKVSMSLKNILIEYKKNGYNGGINIFGTGVPWMEGTLKMPLVSKLSNKIPHSLSTFKSLNIIIANNLSKNENTNIRTRLCLTRKFIS